MIGRDNIAAEQVFNFDLAHVIDPRLARDHLADGRRDLDFQRQSGKSVEYAPLLLP